MESCGSWRISACDTPISAPASRMCASINEKFVALDWASLMTGGTFSRDGRYPRAGLSEDDEVRGQVLLIRFAVHRAKSLTKSLGEVEREMLKPKQLRECVEWTHNHGEAAIKGKSRCTAMRAAHVPIV